MISSVQHISMNMTMDDQLFLYQKISISTGATYFDVHHKKTLSRVVLKNVVDPTRIYGNTYLLSYLLD